MEKQLVVEALKLYLKEETKIDVADWNVLCEFAPYTAKVVADSFSLNLGEMRALLNKQAIEFDEIELKISRL